MMVIFLAGLVSMILMRTLRNDYAKYAREDDDLDTLVSVIPVHIILVVYLIAWQKGFVVAYAWFATSLLVKLRHFIGRREMLMRNQGGSWFMVMYFDLLEV
jgi:branched-subunit amino acid transport protein AzlD